ncbi:hypothetical protein C7445_1185 [Alicyclobacillus sacchari]|uniref:Uncharacterized protein n=1 Tax=Alicyclobacillus sacchari TaxID=392010 RepID=A0A4R8LG92_9BACL|nr:MULTISPECIES: hypothetical protein [Alicyclobacillus]TDY42133.1 hypothetical protein C7445_1185 [Alicyclobacillus sacchari]GMA59248.1 hypothetical protein GCM10025858_37510 [Alicyclobacillus sacchari]GMA59391.1 hypothetical protein GCM10025858_38940 [Alicyclobacillus sacchari]
MWTKRWTGFLAASALAATISGCGTIPHATSQTSSSSITTPSVHAVMDRLPGNLQAKLIGFDARKKRVSHLPIAVKGSNVLYISPMEQYAIQQFHQIWPRLKVYPVVVWTGVTKTQAETIWRKEGYPSDPLPSAQTEYVPQTIPTPDAYHRDGKAWKEVPGILPVSQQEDWVTFFH